MNPAPDSPRSSYSAAGVDYETLDQGKRDALGEALTTSGYLQANGGRALDESRGEPAFVFSVGGQSFAFVLECLGTKSIIARQCEDQLGSAAFANVAYDTVAAIVNDLCCVGALPLVVNAYFATGSSEWYRHPDRTAGLLRGWREACADAEATWGGGESPSLPRLVAPSEIELAGSAVGIVPPGSSPILGAGLAAGDEIVLVASNGLHANGASLARRVAEVLDGGYGARLPSGRTFGEAVLDRSLLYAPLVRRLLQSHVPVHYMSHITGHGLLKLMRPRRELAYRIERLPPVPEVLTLLVQRSGLSPTAAYSTFNMGCGFAIYCAPGTGESVVRLAEQVGLTAQVAGRVESGPRRVILDPVEVVYESADFDLSPRQPV